MSFASIAVWSGVAVVAVSGSIIGGIIVSTLNNGDNHKIKMTASPPPPAARRVLESEELYGKGNPQYDLTQKERAIFSTLAHRHLASGKAMR